MHLSTKNCVRSVGAAVLCILAFGAGALAQTLSQPQVKAGRQLALAHATQAPPTPAPARAQPIWGVNCVGTPGGLDCRANQTVQMSNTGQVTVAVRLPPETKKPVMLLLLPMGIYLPAGVTVQFGQDAAKTVPLNNCDSAGCLAEYAITEAEIGAMLKGIVVTISVQGRDKQPISVQVPATGFPAAYAKIK